MTKIKSFSTSIGAKPMTAKSVEKADKKADKEEPDKKAAAAEKAEKDHSVKEKGGGPAPKVMKPVMTSMGIKTKK